ncbi:MAG: DUF5723 family protein [Halanaerobiales bacterium]
MKNKLRVISFVCLTLMLIFSGIASAQTGKIAGLGSGFAGLEGSDALYFNPALVNPPDDVFTLETNIAVGLWNNGISSDYLNQHWEDDIKGEIMDAVADDGLILSGGGNQDLRLILGNTTFFAGLKEEASGTLSPDLVELILEGNEISSEEEEILYKLDGTALDFAVYGDAGANLSFSLDRVAEKANLDSFKVGGAYHYLYGAFGKGEGSGETEFNYDNIVDSDGEVELRHVEEGEGFAYDVGMALGITERMTIGASLLNVGKIKAEEHYLTNLEYTTEGEDGEAGFEAGEEPELIEEELEYELPKTVRLGLGYDWGDSMDVYSDYSQTTYSEDRVEHQITAGAEFNKLKFIPLRFGVSYSNLQKDFIMSGGMGLHLGPMQVDLGFSDLSAFYNDTKSGNLGISGRIAF